MFLVIYSNIDSIYAWLGQHADQLFFYRLSEVMSSVFFDEQTRQFAKRFETLSGNTVNKTQIIFRPVTANPI